MDQELSEKDKKTKAQLERQLAGKEFSWQASGRRFFARLPSDPRCTLCLAPFEGWGASILKRTMNKERSRLNPLFCNHCEEQAKKFRISI